MPITEAVTPGEELCCRIVTMQQRGGYLEFIAMRAYGLAGAYLGFIALKVGLVSYML